jgi:hypothetical protein
VSSATDHINEQASLYFAKASDAEQKAEESWDDRMRDTWHSLADSWRALATITTKHY